MLLCGMVEHLSDSIVFTTASLIVKYTVFRYLQLTPYQHV